MIQAIPEYAGNGLARGEGETMNGRMWSALRVRAAVVHGETVGRGIRVGERSAVERI